MNDNINHELFAYLVEDDAFQLLIGGAVAQAFDAYTDYCDDHGRDVSDYAELQEAVARHAFEMFFGDVTHLRVRVTAQENAVPNRVEVEAVA